MKTILKSILLLVVAITLFNCDNDDNNADNQDDCNYAGFTFFDSNNTQTLIPESDLITDFYYTSSNGPEVEIYKAADPGNFWFVTLVVTDGATGGGQLSVNGTIYNVNVTCQRAGNAVGEEFRYDISGGGIEAEYCVKINFHH